MLLFVAVGLLVADLGWLLSYQSDTQDFQLEATQQVVTVEDVRTLPFFDADRRRWVKEGKEISSLVPLLQDDDPEGVGPDSIGLSVAVRIDENSKSQAARQAYLLLAEEGICQVALFSINSNQQQKRLSEAPVFRLLVVRSDEGHISQCVDRVNSGRAASSEVRQPPELSSRVFK